jgi:uncharacterized protein
MKTPADAGFTRPSRRRVATVAVGVLALVALCIACIDTYFPRLRTVTLPVPGLSREIRVLQVSDLGSVEFGHKQSRLAALIDGRSYDAIVLTGDMLGQPTRVPIMDLAEMLKGHSDNIWYLSGNHDSSAVGEDLAAAGVPSLPTTRAVSLAPRGATVGEAALVFGRDERTIAAATGTGRQVLVIASHSPPDRHRLAAGVALGKGTHLYVAGHTHGGQVRIPFIGAVWAPLSWSGEQRDPAVGNEITLFPELKGRLVDGSYESDGQHIFVSRGLDANTSGLRFVCRAEIVEYRFVPSPSK